MSKSVIIEEIPNVTTMRRYADDIECAKAGEQFGFGLEPDPGYKAGDELTF